jgi:hypothetical protein
MRNYDGLSALAEIKDPLIKRNFYIIDRYLRLLNTVGLPSGQPSATGASGGSAPPCCQNEVDEFEVVNDSTEGVLGFGRAVGDLEPSILTGHVYTRIEGWEHGTQLNLNGDTTAGAVSVQAGTKRSGSYALSIPQDGVTAANVSLAAVFEGTSGHPSTTTTVAAVAFRFYIRFSALPDATRQIFAVRGAAGAVRTSVSMTSAGVLVLDATNGTTALTTGTWYKITGTYDSVSNKVFLLINDAIEFNNVTAAGSGGAGSVLTLLFGKTTNAGTYTMFVDDVAIEGDAAIANITYPPSAAIIGCPVRANGQVQDVFAISGSSPAATRWESVNIPHDGAVTNIAVTGGTDVASTYTLAVPSTVRGRIHAVQWSNFIATDTVVATTQRIVAAASDTAVEAGLTQLTTTSAGTSTTAYRMYSHLRMANPFSAAAWTAAAVNAMVIGVSTTPGGGVTFRASTITVQVEVAEGQGSDVARAFRVTPNEGYIIPAYMVADAAALSSDSRARLIAGSDGVNSQFILTDTSGRLVVVGGSGVATDYQDATAFTAGAATSRVIVAGYVADDPLTNSLTDQQVGYARLDLSRRQLMRVVGATDANRLDIDASGRALVSIGADTLGFTVVDDTASNFVVSTGRIVPAGFLFDDALTDTIAEDRAGIARIDGSRRQLVRVVGSTDTSRLQVDANGEIGLTELPTAAALTDTDANPITTKIGAVLMYRNEGLTTLSRVSGETHATDEAGNTDDAGAHISEVHKTFTVTLSNISTAYDSAAETATSQSIDCRRFRYAVLTFTLDSTGTPTDIIFDVERSPDNSNFFKFGDSFLQDLRYDDTVCATAINQAITIPLATMDRFIRVTVISAGCTGAGTKFDVTNAKMTFGN